MKTNYVPHDKQKIQGKEKLDIEDKSIKSLETIDDQFQKVFGKFKRVVKDSLTAHIDEALAKLEKWIETQHGTAGWETKLENLFRAELEKIYQAGLADGRERERELIRKMAKRADKVFQQYKNIPPSSGSFKWIDVINKFNDLLEVALNQNKLTEEE